jgi:hypothetical protein
LSATFILVLSSFFEPKQFRRTDESFADALPRRLLQLVERHERRIVVATAIGHMKPDEAHAVTTLHDVVTEPRALDDRRAATAQTER